VISTIIVGASGRMGLSMIRLLPEFPALRLGAALVSTSSSHLGQDAGLAADCQSLGVPFTAELQSALRTADVVIDFSAAAAVPTTLGLARAAKVPLLIGTTGLSADLGAQLDRAAVDIPVLTAANTSIGVNLLLHLVEQAARALPIEFNIEIVEAHHRHKRDAPSGTALALGAAAARGRDLTGEYAAQWPRGAAGVRQDAEIGYAIVRGGDVVGEHDVLFLGNGERLRLAHSATDRSVFARGALQAAQWLAAQPAGRYKMSDIISVNKQ